MIARINGTLEFVGEDVVHVAVGDLWYELYVPAADIRALQTKVGQRVTFFTLEFIEGNANFGQLAPKLIGFLRAEDKEFFNLFTTVKGIGTRKALRALSEPVSRIASAIMLKDARQLTQLPEIGKRTAEQIIVELSGKVGPFAVGGAAVAVPAESRPSFQQDAIAALVALGERRPEVETWVDRACKADGTIANANALIAAVYRLKNAVR